MSISDWRQRISGSARGLACSTFSGVVGIEAELRDPRAPGKQQISRARNQESIIAGNDRKRRRAETAGDASSSLRDLRSGGEHDHTQRDFDAFCADSRTVEQPLLEKLCPSSGYHLRTEYHRPETWHLAGEEDETMLDDELEDHSSAQVHESTQELRSTAAQRLDLVQQHLSTMRLSVFHQRALNQPYVSGDSRSFAADMASSSIQQGFAHNRLVQHHQVHQKTDRPVDEYADEDEDQVQGFHCPFVDCHHNLEPSRLDYLQKTYGRICVHVDCDWIFDNRRDWLSHIVTPHHDIQSSLAEDPQMEVDGSAIQPNCHCDTDQFERSRNILCANCCSLDLSNKNSDMEI